MNCNFENLGAKHGNEKMNSFLCAPLRSLRLCVEKDIKFIHIFTVVILFTHAMLAKEPKSDFGYNIFTDPSKTLEQRVEDLLSHLTLEEKASLFAGRDLWHFNGIERLGFPSVQVTDCGHGVTVILDEQGNYTGCATCFPTAVAQGASWNRDLLYDIGRALARETRATGSAMLLAPMVNIHRTPLGGRNYETFSEDPFLTGALAAAFVNGVQSEHIGACIKVLTANNQQTNQHNTDVIVSERALREIYLPAIKFAIDHANPWAVMTAYNKVNGEPAASNKHLITDILKNEWAYNGMVISDWRSVHSIESLFAGLDLEMPGPGQFMRQQDILQALKDGLISEEKINDCVKRFLRFMIRSKLLDQDKPVLNAELNSAVHQKLTLRAAEESIILLKNDNLLPLDKSKLKKLAVFGPNASTARLGGGGSASVTACYAVSPLAGILDYCQNDIQAIYKEGCSLDGDMAVIPKQNFFTTEDGEKVCGLTAEFFQGNKCDTAPVHRRIDDQIDFSWGWAAPCSQIDKNAYAVRWTGELVPTVSGSHTLGITCFEAGVRFYLNEKLLIDAWGDPDDEIFEARFTQIKKTIKLPLKAGVAYPIKVEFYKKMNRNKVRLEWRPPGQVDPIDDAVEPAAECDAAIVFAGLSNFYEGGNNDRETLSLPGAQDDLIRRIARANPNTIVVLLNGTPVTMPWLDTVRAVIESFYPGQEGGHAIAQILFGEVNPSGKLPVTFPQRLQDNPSHGNFPGKNNEVFYKEGIYVGYRHYDTKNIKPLFPFGHGLSYTQFEYSQLFVSEPFIDHLNVQLTLKNIGDVFGKEVVQLYVSDIESSVDRPPQELKAFDKVELAPNESKKIHFVLDKDAFSYYDVEHKQWRLEPGEFEILIGSSSRDIRLRKRIMLF